MLTRASDATTTLTVDAVAVLPRGCVDEKDHRGGKWALRRAAWLAAAADAVAAAADAPHTKKKKKKDKAVAAPSPLAGAGVTWVDVDGDARRPTLVVTLAAAGAGADAPSPTLAIRLLPSLPPAVLPLWLPRLTASRAAAVVAGGGGGGGATPCYDASVVADSRPDAGAAAAAAAATSTCPSAADGLALATLWARSQALDPASDPTAGVSFATLAALAARAAAAGALPRAMTPLQAARAVLAGVASLGGGGVCVVPGEGEAGLPPPAPASAWPPPALLPPAGWVNLLATATPAGLARASTAAAAAVAALDAARGEGGDAVAAVEALWLSRRPSRWLPDYDAFWRVTLPAQTTACLAGDVPAARAVEARVERVASQALGTRAHTVRALPRPLTTHPAAGPSLPPTCGGPILVAAVVDAVAFRRRLDVGPRADSAEASAAFRTFWGDAAELRRFEDGSIHEAVLWAVPGGGGAGGAAAADAAVAAALARHVDGATSVGLTGVLAPALTDRRADPAAPPAALDAALTRLAKMVRGAPGVALKAVGVTPLSRAARRADPFPPSPHPLLSGGLPPPPGRPIPRTAPAVEVAVQVEGSGRWPDDPAAAARVRSALGVQLATSLSNAYGVTAAASEAGIDVTVDGFVLRLRLWCDRDADAAARLGARAAAAAAAGAPRPPLSPESEAALDASARLQSAIAHAGALAPLGGCAPGFGEGARLLARWAGGHLASSRSLPDPVWELIAAAAAGPRCAGGAGGGLAPPPGAHDAAAAPPPATGLAVFAASLRLLASTPWRERPLLIDPAGAMPAKARAAALRRRDGGGSAPLALVSTADPSGTAWTSTCPRPVVARLTALAATALAALDGWLEGQSEESDVAASVFRAALADFDALLWLKPAATPAGGRRPLPGGMDPPPGRDGRARPAGRCGAAVAEIPPPALASRGPARAAADVLRGFDPVVLYAAELEARYGAVALIGRDGSGGYAPLGVKWRPSARRAHAPGDLPAPTRPVSSWKAGTPVDLVTLDDGATLDEMCGVGAGLADGWTRVRTLEVEGGGDGGRKRARREE